MVRKYSPESQAAPVNPRTWAKRKPRDGALILILRKDEESEKVAEVDNVSSQVGGGSSQKAVIYFLCSIL